MITIMPRTAMSPLAKDRWLLLAAGAVPGLGLLAIALISRWLPSVGWPTQALGGAVSAILFHVSMRIHKRSQSLLAPPPPPAPPPASGALGPPQ